MVILACLAKQNSNFLQFLLKMEQQKSVQPRQKVITILLRTYNHAIQRLKHKNYQEGVALLQSLLQHPYIDDSDMQNLKFSIFMSLGEVHNLLESVMLAVGYYWSALELHQKRCKMGQGRDIKARLQNQERTDQQFTILLKMILLIQNTQHTEELIFLLKRAIKISPSLWREKLLQKLRSAYLKQANHQCLEDLHALIQNKVYLEEVLNQPVQKQSFKKSDEVRGWSLVSHQIYVQKICLKVNLNEKDEIFMKYSCWQGLLTSIYVLLKCKHTRNFNKKKYLHKKYDQSDQNWNESVKKYSPTSTKIQIKIVEKEGNPGQQMQIQNEVSFDKMVHDLSEQLLKYKYGKKKSKKAVNPFQQLSRLPSVSTKDTKKVPTTQTKSIYGSMSEFFKQIFMKSNINKQKLKYLREFNQELFNKILAKTLNDEPIKQKIQIVENEDDEIQASNSVAQEVNPTSKEIKQKKSLKAKKAQLIERNKSLSLLISSVLKIENETRTKQFANVIELLHQILESIFSAQHGETHLVFKNIGIKNILQKDIIKILELGDGFFQNINSVHFFDLLMEKLQSIIDKDCKTKEFKSHQQNKINIISAFIKQKYLPKTYDLEKMLTQDLSTDTLRRLTHLSQNFCRFYSLYQMSVPSEMSFYRQLYIIFKKKLESKINNRDFNEKERQKAIISFIDRQIQKYQKKVVSKTGIMAIKDENEEAASTVDQIYKKDQQISTILPLLKIFNCHPELSKNKNNQMIQQISGQVYLQSFVKLCQIFFKKVELQSHKEFNSRILALLADIMKLKNVVNELYDKFIDTTLLKSPNISKQLYLQTLFYLIKIYLLNLQESDNYLKISFFITNLLFRNQQEEKKSILLPKIICSFDELIKLKKFKPDMLNSIRKRLYQNLILKNLSCIYNSPLMIQNGPKPDKKDSANNKMDEEIHLRNQSDRIVADENQQIREKLLDLIHDVYFCPQKDKEFNPKRIEEAVSYFVYLLKAYAQMFERKIIQLENDAIKVFRRCYKLYLQKRDEVYKYCEKLHRFKADFQLFMNGQDKIDKNSFMSLLKQQKTICECCSNLPKTHNFYVESLFVIGKYFESQCAQPELYLTKESWIEDSDKDEDYYFEYLTLNLQKQLAWSNIVRVNCLKSFYYFDSLLVEPYEKYKNKFLYTKRLIHLVNQIHPQFSSLSLSASANLEILNILKIKQRELLMLTKKIKLNGVETKQSRELQWKYKEGMKKIIVSGNKLIAEDLRIRYLRLSQLKIKLLWGNIQKDMKQQKIAEDTPIIIQLDDDSQEAKVIHEPSKNIKQLQELIDEARTIIKELPLQEQNYYAIHLQQDIAVQMYILLCKHLEIKLDYFISSIYSSIGLGHTQKAKKIREAEYYLSELNYTLQFLRNGEFMSSNPRYCLKNQNIKVNNDDFSGIQATFSSMFSKGQNEPKTMIKQQRQSFQIFQKNQPIVINEQQNQQAVRQIEGQRLQRMSQQSDKQSRRSHSKSRSSKQNAKSKALKLDIATYIYDKVAKYVIDNNFFDQPINHLKSYLFSVRFQQICISVGKIFMEVIRVIVDLPKYQIKKFRNRRSVVMSLVYCSHLAIKYSKNLERPLQLIKDYINMKSQVITNLNLYNDKLCAEKNELLSDFYNRSIVHQIMKIEFIRHLFDIYSFQKNKEAFVLLNKKLLKLSKLGEHKVQKTKAEKNGEKQAVVVEGDQGKKTKEKETIDLNTSKQSKESKDAQGIKTLEAQTAFSLFCEGSMHFMEILRRQVEMGEIDQKYEKNLLEFKNKIKKQIKAEQKNIFYSKIEDFLNFYQQKYNKKIKMKKMKKDKEGQVLPVIMEKSAQIKLVQKLQKQQLQFPINVQEQPKNVQKGNVERSRSKSSENKEQKNKMEQKVEIPNKRKRKQVKQVKQSIRRLSSKRSKSKKEKAIEQPKQQSPQKKKQIEANQPQEQKYAEVQKQQSSKKKKQSPVNKEPTARIKRVISKPAGKKSKKQTPSKKSKQT